MRHAKLTTNLLIFLICLVASFFIVLFPLGGLLDYLSQVGDNFLNQTGLGFSDGEADPAFLWVLAVLMLMLTGSLMFITCKIRTRLRR